MISRLASSALQLLSKGVCVVALSQSLAGRVGRLESLPLSLAELNAHNDGPRTLGQTLLRRSYPALYAQPVDPQDWFSN